MFKRIKAAFTNSKTEWNAAGYWAEVGVEYGRRTGLNLAQAAKVSHEEKLLGLHPV